MKLRLMISTLCVASVAMAGCASKVTSPDEYSGFLSDYSQLKEAKSPSGAEVMRWVDPKLDLSRYHAVFVEPTQFYPKPQATAKIPESTLNGINTYYNQATLLATWVTDRQGLERFAGDTLPVTDDQPRIEYAPWVRSKEITRVLPALLDLRVPVPLIHADETFARTLAAEQQRLMQFYRASLHAYDGDRDAWGRDMREVIRGDGANPYFRWFGGQ